MNINIKKLDFKIFNQTDKFLPVDLCVKAIAVFCFINIAIILPDINILFGSHSLIHHSANSQHIFTYQPTFKWFTDPLSAMGIHENVTILNIFALYILSCVLMFFDKYRFASSIAAWFIHLVVINSSFLLTYGADNMITVLLLVNILFCVPFRNEKMKKAVHSFAFIFLQIQMCFIYFFGGFGKSLGVNWFDGNAMWFVLNIYNEESVGMALSIIDYPIVFKILSWSIILLEFLYPVLIYVKKIKKWLLLKIILMHAFIAIIMGLYTFAGVMILLNLIAFGHYFNWKKIVPRGFVKYITPKGMSTNLVNT